MIKFQVELCINQCKIFLLNILLKNQFERNEDKTIVWLISCLIYCQVFDYRLKLFKVWFRFDSIFYEMDIFVVNI